MPYFFWKNHKLFYREQGEGPLLVVLPGNTASSRCHQAELDYFSDRFKVAALDFLGTGGSERVLAWAKDWWAQCAAQAAALVEHLGYGEAVLVGTSGGAVVALQAAGLFPGIARAIVADSFSERFTQAMAEEMSRERTQRTPDQIRFWEFAHGADWEAVVGADTAMLVRFAETGGEWFAGILSGVRCPVLLTASREDGAIPGVSEQLGHLCAKIADCRVFINHRGGHPLMWSSPGDFRAVVDDFLKSIL